MFGANQDFTSVDLITHVIQVALTPVFLLSAIAALLNVFSTRLGRVADRVDLLASRLEDATESELAPLARQLSYLRRRSLVLDIAVVLGAVGGAATCGAAFALFLGALRDGTAASILLGLFGFALLCTIAALAMFAVEMMMASGSLRAEVRQQQEESGVPPEIANS
jgi:hypothetical protein